MCEFLCAIHYKTPENKIHTKNTKTFYIPFNTAFNTKKHVINYYLAYLTAHFCAAHQQITFTHTASAKTLTHTWNISNTHTYRQIREYTHTHHFHIQSPAASWETTWRHRSIKQASACGKLSSSFSLLWDFLGFSVSFSRLRFPDFPEKLCLSRSYCMWKSGKNVRIRMIHIRATVVLNHFYMFFFIRQILLSLFKCVFDLLEDRSLDSMIDYYGKSVLVEISV